MANPDSLESYEPWVRKIARRFHPNERDDCVQVGLLVVARKLAEFDPSRGIKLETFAKRRVLGAMLDHLRQWKPLILAGELPAVVRIIEPADLPHGIVSVWRHGQRRRCRWVACHHCTSPFLRRVSDPPANFCSRSCAKAPQRARVCPCGRSFSRRQGAPRGLRNRCPECVRTYAWRRKLGNFVA